MKRRGFLAAVGAAGAASAARGQSARMPVIGYLNPTSLELYSFTVDAFREGLRVAGFVEGANVRIEFRWGGGDYGRLPALAAELAALNVSAIAATGDVGSARAAKAATGTIPIVFTIGSDPVQFGLVSSIARPGGNTTGVSNTFRVLGEKRVSLLREIAPRVSRIALLLNPSNPNTVAEQKDAEDAASALGLKSVTRLARTVAEIDDAFADFEREGADGLFTAADPFLIARRVQIVGHERRLSLPAIHIFRQFTDVGGLMNYGPHLTDMYRQAGLYVGQILKGAKPAELPVVQLSRFHMAINLSTAKALGLTVPQSLAALADDLIE